MRISIEASVFTGINVCLGAVNAYYYFPRWVTFFALGVLAGTITGRADLRETLQGYSFDKWSYGNAPEEDKFRQEAAKRLMHSTPGLVTCLVNAFAILILTKKVVALPIVRTCVGDSASLLLGYKVGRAIQLGRLATHIKQDVVIPPSYF